VPGPGTGVFVLEFGVLELHADGSYIYTLDNSDPMIQALNDGQQLQDTMTYVASDGTFSAIGAITVTIHGVGNNTQWPVANVDPTDWISEDETSPRTGNVLDNDFDADGDTLIVTNPGEYVLDYGTLVIGGDGSYAYTVNNAAVQWLHFPQAVEDVFEYRITDQQGGFGSMDLTFHVFGLDDAPVAVDDVNSITEDAVPNTVTGNVLANDTDAEGDLLSTPGDPRITSYGTLVMNSDGSYVFTLDNSNPEVNGLNDSETLTATIQHYVVMDHFVIDGIGYGQVSETATLTITIHGVTDHPGS
jgi:VCBS repeat-containing protein